MIVKFGQKKVPEADLTYFSEVDSLLEHKLKSEVNWLFNDKSTQKGQFVPTVGEGNWHRRLRMANDTQCIILNMLHN